MPRTAAKKSGWGTDCRVGDAGPAFGPMHPMPGTARGGCAAGGGLAACAETEAAGQLHASTGCGSDAGSAPTSRQNASPRFRDDRAGRVGVADPVYRFLVAAALADRRGPTGGRL